MQYRTKDGDRLDAICRTYYGQQSGVVETVLEANPGLADKGTLFSAGVLIDCPPCQNPVRPSIPSNCGTNDTAISNPRQ